jgi:type II secretory pathway pseudopilin PulG
MEKETLHGFSLIESLIAVVICLALMGVFMPVFLKAKENNLDREAFVTLKQIQAAEKM